jgi:hypothetical protein
MQHHFCKDRITYTGKELRSRWVHESSGIEGDAITAFIGPADVPIENMVDLEDVANNAPIKSDLMLHFIAEHFGIPLERGVQLQRLLVAIIYEELVKRGVSRSLERRGDDIYGGDGKLSVSIAAPSPKSICIHTALNISSENTPVPTIGLDDYNVEPVKLASDVMKRYCDELDGMAHACAKVRSIP